MAKKVIDCLYTFTPGTRTVTITNRFVRQESLLLITNVTRGVVIYNFSDPDLGATSYVGNAANSAVNVSGIGGITNPQASQTTTIVLNYNTSAMSSTDKIQIIIDEQTETFIPSDVFTDPVQKLRVSTPQSLIDTDFEYSVQPSKWEFLNTVSNWPSYFTKGTGGNSFNITAISGNGGSPRSTITVTTALPHGLLTGDVAAIQETTNQLADGTFLVTVIGGSQFTYVAKGFVSGSILDSGYTVAYGGGIFDNATIAVSSFSGNGAAQSLVTVTTVNPHGLFPGAPIVMNNFSTTQVNGNWVVTNVSTPTQFQFQCASVFSGGGTIGSGRLYTSPEGYVYHRSTDGGVSITPGGNYVNTQAIRQTRRYFRYQSGKAMQFSTGWKGTPTHDIDTITGSGTTASITTIQDHNLQAGATVLVEGLTVTTGTNFYNGTFIVTSITGTKSFTYTMAGTPTDTAPVGDTSTTGAFVTCTKWNAGATRVGLFDDQNGFYFEYDGNQIFACRRQSIKEMFGRIAATQNSEIITGTGTRFRRQLVAGDFIVIRGQSYQISQIDSDTQLRITPTYKGPSNANTRYLRTQTFKVPQSQWNQDRLDGTGPSGYNLDISKMQMAYIDYTWYGAGHIRFGFRGVNGDIIYCHRMPNNNVNNAAYMRSGNLPGRFEVSNVGYYSKLMAGASITRGTALGSTDTTMYIENAQFWPTSGAVIVRDATNCEVITYTGIGAYNATAGGYPLTGLTRRTSYNIAGVNIAGSFSTSAYNLSGTASGVTFTPDVGSGGGGTSQVSVQYIQNTCAPISSHWGVSCIMDGRYDEDKSFIFTAGQLRYSTCQAGVERPLLMIRIAPSVDSGNGRNFGVREILNRMQLTLATIGVYSQGQFLIQGRFNPSSITGSGLSIPASWDTTPGSVGSGSLSQVYYFDGTGVYSTTPSVATGVITGGDRIFGFYTENSGGSNFSATQFDLSRVRDLGTSILSGNGTPTNPSYPNGPDILVITATLLEASGTKNIACRIGWTEAQA